MKSNIELNAQLRRFVIPDSRSPLSLSLVHPNFIIVQGCGMKKKYVVYTLSSMWFFKFDILQNKNSRFLLKILKSRTDYWSSIFYTDVVKEPLTLCWWVSLPCVKACAGLSFRSWKRQQQSCKLVLPMSAKKAVRWATGVLQAKLLLKSTSDRSGCKSVDKAPKWNDFIPSQIGLKRIWVNLYIGGQGWIVSSIINLQWVQSLSVKTTWRYGKLWVTTDQSFNTFIAFKIGCYWTYQHTNEEV